MSPEEAPSNPIVGRSTDSTGSPQGDSGQALRRRAEAIAGERAGGMPEDLEVLSPEVARRALHELRVHQIELEMQNEELRRTQEELEVSPGAVFRPVRSGAGGLFHIQRTGVNSGGKFNGSQVVWHGKRRFGQSNPRHFFLHFLPVGSSPYSVVLLYSI